MISERLRLFVCEELRPQAMDCFGFNLPSKFVIRYHWLTCYTTVLSVAEFSLDSFLKTILENIFAMSNKQLLRFILLHCNVSLKNYKHHQAKLKLHEKTNTIKKNNVLFALSINMSITQETTANSRQWAQPHYEAFYVRHTRIILKLLVFYLVVGDIHQ